MYEYTPRPDRRAGMALSLGLVTVGLLLLIPNSLVLWLALMLRTLGLCLIASAFPLADRFVLTFYTYSLTLESGEPELIITERRRRRIRVVCRIYCSAILTLTEPGGALEKTDRRFNYCPDLRRRQKSHILTLDDDGRVAIAFCPDKRLCELILSYINDKND